MVSVWNFPAKALNAQRARKRDRTLKHFTLVLYASGIRAHGFDSVAPARSLSSHTLSTAEARRGAARRAEGARGFQRCRLARANASARGRGGRGEERSM